MEAEDPAGFIRLGNSALSCCFNADGNLDEFTVYSQTEPTRLAYAGLTSNASEYLASGTNNFTMPFAVVDASGRGQYLFVGSDARFRGLNVALAINGAGNVDLAWEYWNGTVWTNLESVAGFTDETNHFAQDGTLYWTADPAGWSEYSVNGGPDLFYVRAALGTGAYTTSPAEGLIKTDIVLVQYCGDITLPAQTFDFATPTPTAVDLVSFEATASDGGVELRWETASELDNLGFHVYRSTAQQGPYERITASLIPGLGSSPVGASYVYRDVGLVAGVTYHYTLEDVETTDGRRFTARRR